MKSGINSDESNVNIEGLDFDKVLTVLRKSLVWLILIFLITNLIAYLYIRWTKPLYESQSELKLDVKSDASELGLTRINENNNLNIISGEIELLKSRLFFSKVIDAVDLSVGYYTSGNFLVDEKFKTSPFLLDYNLKNKALINQRIYVNILDEQSYRISFTENGYEDAPKYRFGEVVKTPDMEFVLYLTDYYSPDGDKDFFFIINSRDAQISYLAENLTVEPLNLNANTIRIAFKDHNPLKARDLVNAIDTLYLNYTQEEKNLENTQKIEWLNGELKEIETQLEGYENYFENFTIENRTNNLDEDLKNTVLTINKLDSQRYQLAKKTNAVNHLLEDIDKDVNKEILNNNPDTYPDYIIETFNDLVQLIKERDNLQLSYNESTFALSKKEQEIAQLQSTLKNQLENLKNNYKKEIDNLREQKRTLEKNFVQLPGKSTEYNKNQRFFNLYEEFYLSLMQNKAQFQIAQAGTTTDFKILSPATLASNPISPNSLIIQGIGIVSGFILCFIFVSIRYLLHNKITTTQEIERLTSAPILGSVPKTQEKMEVTQLLIDKRPKSAVSESLRAIRTNIEFMVSKGKSKVISVTSTISGEGKTFISVNLGGIMALSRKKVLLMDLDMRKARVHMAFGDKQAEKGISTILINKHNISECIRKTDIDHLDYIPAGPTPPNPSELLLNGEFVNLLNKMRFDYDIIILDTPPVGLVTDGILAMKNVDLSLYIVRSNYSKKIFLNTLNRLISVNKFNNLAVILNAASTAGNNSYGYGYYEEKPHGTINQIKRLISKGV